MDAQQPGSGGATEQLADGVADHEMPAGVKKAMTLLATPVTQLSKMVAGKMLDFAQEMGSRAND